MNNRYGANQFRLLMALFVCTLCSGCARVAWNPESVRPGELGASSLPAPDDFTTTHTLRLVEPVTLSTTETVLLADLPSTMTTLATSSTVVAEIDQLKIFALAATPRENRNLNLESLSYLQSAYDVPAQYGIYDLLGGASHRYTYLDIPGGIPTIQRQTGASLSQLLPTGAVLEGQLLATRSQDADAIGPPAYDAQLGAQVRQPLLRNRGLEPTEANLRRARLDRAIARETYAFRQREEISRALVDYWAWRGAIETWRARLSLLASTRELVRINRARVEQEVAPSIELLQAEAAAAERMADVVEARRALENAADNLRRRFQLTNAALAWDVPLGPGEPLGFFELAEPEIDTLSLELADHPEVRRARLAIEREELETRLTRQARLPILDAFANIVLTGEGSNSGAAQDQIEQGSRRAWSAGLQFEMPFQNRAARYRHRQALASLERAHEQLRDVEDQVTQETRSARHALSAARAALESSERRLASARENLAVASQYYASGLVLEFGANTTGAASGTSPQTATDATSPDVVAAPPLLSPTLELLRFQSDVASAQEVRAAALVAYQQALVRLVYGADHRVLAPLLARP